MKPRALLLAALLVALPALADNYLAITLLPGAGGAVMTYTYTVELTAGPISLTTANVATVANVPLSTSIHIDETPTLIQGLALTLNGNIQVTAKDSAGNVATGTQTFTLALEPGKTNTLDISVSLSNGGSLEGELVLYVAKISIPFAGLAAVGLAGLLGRKIKKN